jgi:glycosyltransferase involved in cell wall biosynthesis
LILLKKLGLIKQEIGSTIDDSLEISQNIQSGMRDRARSFSIKNLDYFIVLSDVVARFYETKFGLPRKSIIVAPLFQDPQRLRKDAEKLIQIARSHFLKFDLKNKKVLLFVGRFIPEKGLLNFVDIISPLLQNNPEYTLVLVGDGAEKTKIQALVEKNGVQSAVVLPGRYEGDELLAWYVCASGFVLPSFYEPFGAVVNEALIFGLRVFCSQFAGSSYLTTPGQDVVFNPHNATESQTELKNFMESLSVKHTVAELPAVRMPIDYNHVFDGWKKSMYDEDI